LKKENFDRFNLSNFHKEKEMAAFRKSLFALVVVALFMGLVSTASAQVAAPFTCNANNAVPTLARSEGLTELMGDIVLQCNGGITNAVMTVNVAVFLANTNITSRILNSSNGSEAVLLIDEPNSGLPGAITTFTPCPWPQTTACTGTGVNNIYQGVINGNRLDFFNVAIVAPGTVNNRILRVTNIRGNANAVGVGASGTPGQIIAFVSIVGPATVPVANPTQTVAFVQPGLKFAVLGTDRKSLSGLIRSQCTSYSNGSVAAVLRFSELFGTAFKQRQNALQDIPGAIYNTESGFIYPPFSNSGSITSLAAGQADFGTRLKATFNNIPVGVSLWVSTTNMIGDAMATGVSSPAVVAQMVAGDIVPAGSLVGTTDQLVNIAGTSKAVNAAKLALSGGVATATWEVTSTSSLIPDDVDFFVYASSSPDLANNLPTPGSQGTVAGSFAPTYTSAAGGVASSTLPIPRFVDTGSGQNFISFVVCRSNLLFPFVTNKAGFDTGLAIANTTTDPFSGTVAQTGTCTLNFYGDDAPAASTTPAVPSGKVWTGLAQTLAPNFQGYVIAQCQFQMAHGFAFVSDVGARNLAMGYLALIIPDQTNNKRGQQVTITGGVGETFGQ